MSDGPLASVIIPCRDESETAHVFQWPGWAEMLYQFEPGIGSARNAGVKRARSDRLVFMDSDVKLSGDLASVILIPDYMDVAWTAQDYRYNGEDMWTKIAAVSMSMLSALENNPWDIPVPVFAQASFMACHRNYFRPFDDQRLEDLRWGAQFPKVGRLPVFVDFARPLTKSLDWRRRRGEMIAP
jgi:glycosyltransferase involved in cell wall biosynthesis